MTAMSLEVQLSWEPTYAGTMQPETAYVYTTPHATPCIAPMFVSAPHQRDWCGSRSIRVPGGCLDINKH